jgi:valyl-tRNA synthetase
VDTTYDEQVVKVGQKLVTKLYNASRFIFGRLDGIDDMAIEPTVITAELDQSFIKRLGEVIVAATGSYERFDWAGALAKVEEFFWAEFCDDYLEIVKGRAKEELSSRDYVSALATLKLTLSVLIRLFAPVLPTITEELWSQKFATETGNSRSVHTSHWPSLVELEKVESPTHSGVFAKARVILQQDRQKKAIA